MNAVGSLADSTATRSPGATPEAASAEAIRPASRWTSAYVATSPSQTRQGGVAVERRPLVEEVGQPHQLPSRVSTGSETSYLLYDSARPFDFRSRGPFDYSIAMLPKDLLALGEDDYRGLTVRPRPGRGPAAAVGRLVTALASRGEGRASERRAAGLQRSLVAMVGALAPAASPDQKGLLVELARAYVLLHLADPRLSPTTVAAACGISVSYLHRLFESESTTVAAFIREERLHLARERLLDPACRGESVAVTGRACGFEDPAHFSRVVRRRFGVPPTDLRRGGAPVGGPVR